MNKECLNCHKKQVENLIRLLNIKDTEEIYKTYKEYMNSIDETKTTPEIMGGLYQILIQKLNVEDPYRNIKQSYNELVLNMEDRILERMNSLETALKMAIVGNLIDFAAKHTFDEKSFQDMLDKSDELHLAIDDSKKLFDQLNHAETLLYLGDNCGEIVLDKCFIKVLKNKYPHLDIYYAVRGKSVVNDNTMDDALFVGMDEVAHLISNGDGSLGTVLGKTSDEFNQIFNRSDIVISKGQGNFESLMTCDKNHIFFLFMIKCELVSKVVEKERMSIVCLEHKV